LHEFGETQGSASTIEAKSRPENCNRRHGQPTLACYGASFGWQDFVDGGLNG
jgi:hypothetical protein